jgi:hypothetical protein
MGKHQMMKQVSKIGKPTIILFLFVAAMAVFSGCAAGKAVEVELAVTKRITDLIINQDSNSLIFKIKGNQLLTYTEGKQAFPPGVLFHFPDTALDIGGQTYLPPDNEIIRSIEAKEIHADQTTTASIFIALKREATYDLNSDDAGVVITFAKISAESKDTEPLTEATQKKAEPAITPPSLPAATELKTVTATPLNNNVAVNVQADGVIRDYTSFTVDNPARIVFDLYKLKSPFIKEQQIEVASKWVSRIRHYGYPEKVRLVLETHGEYLANYSDLPTDSGLIIHVGDTPPLIAKEESQAISDGNLGVREVTLTWDMVPDATSYHVYWSDSPGVTKHNAKKASFMSPPAIIKGLKPGATYYFVVTAVKESKESDVSAEISFTIDE